MVQNRPSSHGVPSLTGTAMQPWPGTHVPLAQVLSRTEQSTGGPARQVPFEHVPARVQASMSSHWAPSLPGIAVQVSVTSSQAPIWHASGGWQYLAVPPTHTPLMHTSFSVQN